MENERTQAEQEIIDQREKAFYARTISTGQPGRFIKLWVGPRDRKEIELALAGQPTFVDCSIGPNINNGTMDGSYYKRKHGWKTVAEYEQWLANAKPKDLVFPCPFCNAKNRHVATTADELATHISTNHSSTPDYENKYRPEEMGVDLGARSKEEIAADEANEESALDKLLGPAKEVETKKKAK